MPPDPPSLGVLKHTLVGPLWALYTNTNSLDKPLHRIVSEINESKKEILCFIFQYSQDIPENPSGMPDVENRISGDSQQLATPQPPFSSGESELSISHEPPIQYSVPGLPDSAGAVEESHSTKKSLIPKPSMSKFDTKDDQNFPDKDHPKVLGGIFLV